MKKFSPQFNSVEFFSRAISLALIFWLLACALPARAADPETTTYQNVSAGSYIIDMGQSAQTIANGLKPYGLVYELIVTRRVPILWAINPAKTKSCLAATCADGVDFVAGGKSYSGGTFIIPGEYIDAGVLTSIATWKGKGVVVDGPTTSAVAGVPIYNTLTSVPRIALDTANGSIAAVYLASAEIPGSAYTSKTPAQVDGCDDIFVMPHADPTWATHGPLLGFVRNNKGYLWAACHSVSVLENVVDPGSAANRMNFLSTNGLVLYTNHVTPVAPFDYAAGAGRDPVMQFLNRTDGAHLNGSEQVYLPSLTSQWRASTVIAEFDAGHADIPGKTAGPAAIIAYGRAFGSSLNGKVMYEGGHDHNKTGTVAEKVAAQRAMLNFIFLAGIDRRPDIAMAAPATANGSETISVSASVSGGSSPYGFQWTSTCGGTFASATNGSTTFTAPAVAATTACVLKVAIVDSCGRKNFGASALTIASAPVLPQVIGIAKSVGTPVQVSTGVFDVPYSITVKNVGTVPLTNVQVSDDLVATFAAPVTTSIQIAPLGSAGLTANASYTGRGVNNLLAGGDGLAVGGSGTIKFTVRVTLNASATTTFSGNAIATSSATAGGAAVSTDISNDGDGTPAGDLAAIDPNSNGNPNESGENIPTPVVVSVTATERPLIGIAKRIVSQTVNGDGSFTVKFEILVKNFGDVALSGVQVTGDLSAAIPVAKAGFVLVAPPVADAACVSLTSAGAAYTGNAGGTNLLIVSASNVLVVGASCKFTYNVKVTPVPSVVGNLGPFNTTAIGSGKSPAATLVTDDSADGPDADNGGSVGTPINGDNNPNNNTGPTTVAFNESPKLGVAEAAGTPVAVAGQAGFYDVQITIKVKNYGDTKLSALQVTQNLATAFAAATGFTVSTGAAVTGVTGVGNAAGTGAAFTGKVGGLDLLLAGASLDPGAEATITFTIRVQPGATFAYSLTSNGTSVSAAGTAVGDISNNGANADANGNGDPADDSVPTPVVFAERPLIGVAKRIVSQTANGDGSFTVKFETLVKNYGDVALTGVQVGDDLAAAIPASKAAFVLIAPPVADAACLSLTSAGAAYTGSGGGINLLTVAPSNALAVGASCKFTYSIKITPIANIVGNLGPFNTTAIASGKSPAAASVSDDSVDGVDPDIGGSVGTPINGDNNPNNNTGPTTVTFSEAPKLGVAEAAGMPVAVAGQPGFYDVPFTLKVKNFGDTRLAGIQVTQNLSTAFAAATGFSVSSGATVTALTGVGVATGAGTAFTGKLGGVDLLLAGATLDPGAEATIVFTVRVQPGATLTYGVTSNGTSSSPSGATATDTSTNGANADANGNGDPGDDSVPTPVVFTERPLIGVAKRIVSQTVHGDGSFTVKFETLVKNFGDVALSSVQVTDDLSAAIPVAKAGFALVAPPVADAACTSLTSAGAAYTGNVGGINLLTVATSNTLAVGASCKFSYSIKFTPVPNVVGNLGPFNTTAMGSGKSPAATLVTDDSVDGPDADTGGSVGAPINGDNNPNNNAGPTIVVMVIGPKIGVAKMASKPVNNNNGSFDVQYTVTVRNYGNVNLAGVQVAGDLTSTFASPASFSIVSRGDAGSTLAANPAYSGSAAGTGLLSGTDPLLVGESKIFKYTVRFSPGTRLSPFRSSAVATGTPPTGAAVNDDSIAGVIPDLDGDSNPGNDAGPTVVHVPQVGVANQIGTVVNNGDGTYDVPFRINVGNMSGETLTGVQVANNLATTFPSPMSFTLRGPITVTGGLTASAGYAGTSPNVNLLSGNDTLAVGASAVIGFTVRVAPKGAAGPFANQATAMGTGALSAVVSTDLSNDGAEPDPDKNGNLTDNNIPSKVVFVLAPDLELALRHIGNFTGGVNGSFVLDVKNVGAAPTNGIITVIDTLPAGLRFVSGTGDGWTCSAVQQIISCTNPAVLGSGQALPSITIVVGVEESLIPTGSNSVSITNAATVSVGNELVVNHSNNNVADVTVVNRSATLSGSVWLDVVQNRRRDPQDIPIVGWIVEVLGAPGTTPIKTQPSKAESSAVLVKTAITDKDGRYLVTGLVPGDYKVQFRDPGSNVLFGDPINGEQRNPQPGSRLEPSRAALAVTLAAGDNRIEQSLPIDPSGAVYDAVTRKPVSGAVVALSVASGCGFDPATHLVGTQSYTINSGSAAMTVGALGVYQFMLTSNAPACTYVLKVSPPAGYAVSTLILPQLGALTPPITNGLYPVQPQVEPPQPGQATTYYTQLKLAAGSAGVVHNHIPLDPTVKAVLFVQKTASPSEAELGDSILYTVTVKNSSTSAIPGVVETDQLPAGFRYIEGTSRLNGARIADPAGGAGPVLTFAIGSLNAGEERKISFRVRIGVGAQQGDGVSRAYAASGAVRSNEARAAVRVQGGAFSDKAIVLGKVYVDCNADRLQNIGEPGIPGVRLYIEDGTFTVTDGEGKYSFYGLSARTHVLKVDPTTLPAASKLVPLSTRNAGDADTVFLSAKFNGLHRADFAEGSCTPSILDEVRTRRERVNRTAEPFAAPARESNDNNTSSNSGPSK